MHALPIPLKHLTERLGAASGRTSAPWTPQAVAEGETQCSRTTRHPCREDGAALSLNYAQCALKPINDR